jgi:hypothetical protein
MEKKLFDGVVFAMPTYRFANLNGTVKRYSDNFRSFGHDLPMVFFDDGQEISQDEVSNAFDGAENSGGIFYVGRREKAAFLDHLESKTRLCRPLLREIFKPSYGGNRNFTLLYSLGNHLISSDDDMYPEGLLEDSKGLNEREVLRGRYVDRQNSKYEVVSQDIVSAFLKYLGKSPIVLPNDFRGKHIVDSMMDLLTNTTRGGDLGENVLSLAPGEVNENATIKVAQTYRTGSSDVDAKDYAEEFLENPELVLRNDMSQVYVISDFVPCITAQNWRIDCGVAGYDNQNGLLPFIPTRLRFEDYVFRLWTKREDVASAHVDAVQTHRRSPFNRHSLPSDYYNEELANFLKKQLISLTESINPTSITFNGELNIEENDLEEMVRRAEVLRKRALEKIKKSPERKSFYIPFANDFHQIYEEFDLYDFSHSTREKLHKEYELLKSTMEVWPSILEASLEIEKPIVKVK